MSFDTYNAILFKMMADNRNIKDSNSILLAAGLSSGSPITKMMIPFQLVEKTEELEKKDLQVRNTLKKNEQLLQLTEAVVEERDKLKLENEALKADPDKLRAELEKLKSDVKKCGDTVKSIHAIVESADGADEKVGRIKQVLSTVPNLNGVPVPVNG
jgi:seryl-tRNA synthetase